MSSTSPALDRLLELLLLLQFLLERLNLLLSTLEVPDLEEEDLDLLLPRLDPGILATN